jgi:hypothetical protein
MASLSKMAFNLKKYYLKIEPFPKIIYLQAIEICGELRRSRLDLTGFRVLWVGLLSASLSLVA